MKIKELVLRTLDLLKKRLDLILLLKMKKYSINRRGKWCR